MEKYFNALISSFFKIINEHQTFIKLFGCIGVPLGADLHVHWQDQLGQAHRGRHLGDRPRLHHKQAQKLLFRVPRKILS